MSEADSTQRRTEQPPGMHPLVDPETAIQREVEVVAERFPDTDVDTVDSTVRGVVEDLRAGAEVQAHVLALSRQRAYDRLREQGEPFRSMSTDDPGSEAKATGVDAAEGSDDAGAG